MVTRIPGERLPEDEPWADREFLECASDEQGLSPREIAFELGVSKSPVIVYMEFLGLLQPALLAGIRFSCYRVA